MKKKSRRHKLTGFLLGLIAVLWSTNAECAAESKSREKEMMFSVHFNSFAVSSKIKSGWIGDFGYPKMLANCLGIEWGYLKRSPKFEHRLAFAAGLPARVSFDDGLGYNRTLNEASSHYFDLSLNYNFVWYFFNKKKLSVGVGAAASEWFSHMELDYLSIGKSTLWDFNTGLGISGVLLYKFNDKLKTRMELLSLYYIPQLSYGKVADRNEEHTYGANLFNLRFSLLLCCRISRKSGIEFGYARSETGGNGILKGEQNSGSFSLQIFKQSCMNSWHVGFKIYLNEK
jgi:hypothetical protein